MLKRFLKFFKQSEALELPEFEGSYLDYLMSRIEPEVIGELEACPEHDALLLVIAEMLRASMPQLWSATIDRPLRDRHSPSIQLP